MSRTTLKQFRRASRRSHGWFSWQAATIWDSLLDFQQREGIRGDLLEIGVYHGRSAAMMLLHTRPDEERCVLVDYQLARDRIARVFRRLPKGAESAATLIERDSMTLRDCPEVMDRRGHYRWIHIDGGHTARLFLNDLELAHEVASGEAVIALDDIHNWAYPQLTEQMVLYLDKYPERFTLFLTGINKAYLARPAFVRRYLDHCYHTLIDDVETNGRFKACLAKSDSPDVLSGFGIGSRLDDGRRYRGPDIDLDRVEY